MIALEDVSFTFPRAAEPALRDIDLTVEQGEFILVAGPSGAGKSTLLRLLNGLVPHFSGGHLRGRVRVAGLDVIGAGPARLSRHVGFVFQDPEAQAVLDSVEAEIAFGLENAAVPPAEMRRRVAAVMELLGLTGLRDRALVTLSGGERQRVAIAAALALQPRILVLDEPTSQLDPRSATDVLDAVTRLHETIGLTVILAEHRLERVAARARRLLYLVEGRILFDGPPRDGLDQIPDPPPLTRLARALDWRPRPLSIEEGQAAATAAARQTPPAARNGAGAGAAPTAPPLLEARGLQVAYDGRPALRDAELTLRAGEIVALMGVNGAGKSTLLRALVGLVTPTAGEIFVQSRSTAGRRVADISREIAYLPQTPDDLLFAETAVEELRLTLRNHRLPDGAATARAWLAGVGLAEQALAYPRDLSVGQRQRVALGAVAIAAPQIYLLDEPTRGLDAGAKQVLTALWRRWRAAGAGVVLATHDVELVAATADRVVLLEAGRVTSDGAPGEVLAEAAFAPQIAALFPGRGWLTAEQALAGLGHQD